MCIYRLLFYGVLSVSNDSPLLLTSCVNENSGQCVCFGHDPSKETVARRCEFLLTGNDAILLN